MNIPNFKNSNFNSIIIPVKIYCNCEIDKTRILQENKNKIVIYRFINNVNNKTYVGSSINFTNRLYKYFSVKHLTKSKLPIIQALLKYGYSNFSLEILEYCTKDNLIEREQYFLYLLKPEYNILEKAASMWGYKHSEKTIELFRNRIVGE